MNAPTEAAVAAAEDGLDPGDGLTAEEALARVLCILRGYTVTEAYDQKLIQTLLEWERGNRLLRPILEKAGIVARWAS